MRGHQRALGTTRVKNLSRRWLWSYCIALGGIKELVISIIVTEVGIGVNDLVNDLLSSQGINHILNRGLLIWSERLGIRLVLVQQQRSLAEATSLLRVCFEDV